MTKRYKFVPNQEVIDYIKQEIQKLPNERVYGYKYTPRQLLEQARRGRTKLGIGFYAAYERQLLYAKKAEYMEMARQGNPRARIMCWWIGNCARLNGYD